MHQHEPVESSASGSSASINPVEDARKIILEDERRRQETCAEEIAAVLRAHGFDLQVTPPQLTLVKRQQQ